MRASTLVLQSRTERLRFLRTIDTALAVAALAAVMLATGLSYLVARTVTRPLGAITDMMRDVASTGDLTRKITLRGPAIWQDEDARLLATTFNTLTDSIAKFQREAAQKDRLLSLGRLSTVIAHEVRNPLMIIKAALRSVRPDSPPHDIGEAVHDIDEEVHRLDRIVHDVLDFARPPVFSIETIDLAHLCQDAAAAASAAGPGPRVETELPGEPVVVATDGARLRTALVNILANARQAVVARDAAADPKAARGNGGPPDVALRARAARPGTRPPPGPGPWRRHPPAGHGTDLRALFHDAPDRHRARPANCKEHHRGTRRDSGCPHGRRRHDDRYRAARASPRSFGIMTSTGSILLVDDEEKILKTLGRALRTEGHRVVESANGKAARRLLTDESFDVLIVDNLMPGMTGLELIRDLVGSTPEPERPQIVMMTAHATVADAIAAMKLGALDFLQKPFEIDHLLVTINRAVDHQRLRTEHRYLLSERDEEFSHYGIVGRSRTMQDVIHRAERVAETKSTVLITGETGTGKELVARAIHDRSAERHMPLIKVNCAAIPDTLLESELFGHVRGAFTGAATNKKGPLRAGQRRQHLPRRDRDDAGAAAGQAAARAAGAGVRAAGRRAHREGGPPGDRGHEPRPAPARGRGQVPGRSVLPAQRDPDPDSPAARASRGHRRCSSSISSGSTRSARGKPIDKIDEGVVAGLQRYDWPGNVRELENTIERAVVLSSGRTITDRDISVLAPPATQAPSLPSLRLHQNLEWAERESVRRALDQSRGVKKDAAELLGISQRALSYYLAKYRID